MRFLLVEDEPELLGALASDLVLRGYEVFAAPTIEDARLLARTHAPEVALVDVSIEGGSGVEFLEELRSIVPSCGRVLIAGGISPFAQTDLVDFVLPKPWTSTELERALSRGMFVCLSVP